MVSLINSLILHLGPFYFNSFGACAKSTSNKKTGEIVNKFFDKFISKQSDKLRKKMIEKCMHLINSSIMRENKDCYSEIIQYINTQIEFEKTP